MVSRSLKRRMQGRERSIDQFIDDEDELEPTVATWHQDDSDEVMIDLTQEKSGPPAPKRRRGQAGKVIDVDAAPETIVIEDQKDAIDVDAPPVAGPSQTRAGPSNERKIVKINAKAGSGHVVLGYLRAPCVGTSYYSGITSTSVGDVLKVVREPHNAYDRNAIAVLLQPSGLKLGHLSRDLAASLARPMDSGIFKQVEATVLTIPGRGYGAAPSLLLAFRGLSKHLGSPKISMIDAPHVEEARRNAEVQAAQARQAAQEAQAAARAAAAEANRGYHGRARADMANVLAASGVTAQDRQRDEALNDLFAEGGFDPLTLGQHPNPPDSLQTQLLPHQLQALAWLVRQEHPKLPQHGEKPVQLITRTSNGQLYHLGIRETVVAPVLARGGILADDMGLGKTLEIIALISLDPSGQGLLENPETVDDGFTDSTLVVCPLSVVGNWVSQLEEHSSLTYHVYHGDGRNMRKRDLLRYDVVIVPYNTLSSEHVTSEGKSKGKKRAKTGKDGVLHRIRWRRVVYDEATAAKNPKTGVSIACKDVVAERRFSKELGAMLAILQSCAPLNDPKSWSRNVERRMRKGDGPQILKAIINSICLRRTKEMQVNGRPLVALPPVRHYQVEVELDEGARALYNEVEEAVRNRVELAVRANQVGRQYSMMLIYLLRLRQIACDPTLVHPSFIEELRHQRAQQQIAAPPEPVDVDELTPNQLKALQRTLFDLKEEECSICFSELEDPRMTRCGHAYCGSCIQEALAKMPEPSCPMCRGVVTVASLVALPADGKRPPEDEAADAGAAGEPELEPEALREAALSSSKLRKLVEILGPTGRDGDGTRTLVFSQWVSVLDRAEIVLEKASISCGRFDGSMSRDAREEVLRNFRAGKFDVLLLSLATGAMGLNATCASNVVLMDPFWHSAIESQAIDRVNRIGQTREVRVFQLITKNTVEERVLQIQAKKLALVAQAFSGMRQTQSERRRENLRDVLAAFGINNQQIAPVAGPTDDVQDDEDELPDGPTGQPRVAAPANDAQDTDDELPDGPTGPPRAIATQESSDDEEVVTRPSRKPRTIQIDEDSSGDDEGLPEAP